MNLLLTLLLLADVRTSSIEAFARKAMREIGSTPGMTVVVVKDDKVIYRGDFGLRDVEVKLPVTPDTRFYIGSSTKAFTALMAAILATEGKIDLDAPLSELWPELKLTPPLDPKRFSLRDFLAMRPGLANSTLNFRAGALGNVDDAEALRLLATYSREEPRVFEYSNLSYDIAARVIRRVTGQKWQDLTEAKVFAPLGMNSTTSAFPPAGAPYVRFYRSTAPNVFVRTEEKFPETMGPAGGTFMTSADAGKWLIAMMNDGNGILPKKAVRMVQSPQTTRKARFRYLDRWAWGLGQDLGDYEGELIVHRPGGIGGAYSFISFMPDRRIGVAVFSNGGAAVADAVAMYAYDVLLGKPNLEAKWNEALTKAVAAVQKSREQRAPWDARLADRKTAGRPLAQYTGTYHYDRLGRLDVTESNGRLYAQLGVLRAELIPTGGDAFLADFLDDQPQEVRFVFDGNVRFEWGDRIWTR
ncbi:MAG TPA: serine hydrolase [Thermoanaerobaculia bacterium]|nr:serine hydrolase [Thermoanaerobaculia bacterium]